MYSAVLMLALTAGSETADFGRNRCSSACSTTVVASCSRAARCSHSCHARTPLFGSHCSRSCATSRGCSTTRAVHCSASRGCSTSHGCHGGHFSRRGCQGCSVSYSAPCSGGGIVVPDKKPMIKPEEVKKPKGSTSVSAPATIIVSLPANARLIVDGAPTNSVSDRRVLVTPELEFGATYTYTMQVEIVRDGRTVAQVQQVNVRGGETTNVEFQFPNQGVATR